MCGDRGQDVWERNFELCNSVFGKHFAVLCDVRS